MLKNPKYLKRIILIAFVLLLFDALRAQVPTETEKPVTRILFILDASQSMLAQWGNSTRMSTATKLLTHLVDSVSQIKGIEMALRMYGHQSPVPPQDCNDTRLEVPFADNNAPKIKMRLRNIEPRGTTPIANSLQKCAGDFPSCDKCKNIVILITDGIEACDGDPCAMSLALQKQGIFLRPFVIGIGLNVEFRSKFECIGNYYDANNEQQFKSLLSLVISQAINATTAQVNLIDANGKPLETDVPMTFYDMISKKIRYNYVHTMNNRGMPDTLLMDHLSTYQLQVHTIPPVFLDSIKIIPGRHNIIAVDAPQGFLQFRMMGNSPFSPQILVKKQGACEVLNAQPISKLEKYLTGKYDVEVLTLPVMRSNNLEISQSKTTIVDIPAPGLITLMKNSPGYGGVYQNTPNGLVWVCNLHSEILKETLYIQPGSYRVIFRAKNARATLQTIERSFIVSSGSSQLVNIK